MKILIYKITNLINGKAYIGQTYKGLNVRKSGHIHRANLGERDHKLYRSMRKHGVENFKFEIIFCVFNKEDLDEFETYFIKMYDSFDRGYNMTCGGDSISEETRNKLREVNLGRKITWYDKILESRRRNGTWNIPRQIRYKIKLPSGEIITIRGLSKFARENNLDASNLLKTLSGRNCCKGFMVLERFRDYPEREYAQAGGSAEHPILL